MERNLDKIGEEQPPCPNSVKKSKATEKWMDKDMKEFYMIHVGGD